MIKDNVVFFKQCLSDFHSTGALCRSSKKAAYGLTEPLRQPNRKPYKILELGPGTGAITQRILEDMIPGDQFHTCEINPMFMAALKKRLAKLPAYQRNSENIKFLLCPAQQIPTDCKYDVIVGCLPFLNFDLVTVKEIFEHIKKISHEGTVMTYFEYTGIRTTGRYISKRIRSVNNYLAGIYNDHRFARKRILFNLFPMNIHHLKIGLNNTENENHKESNWRKQCSNY